jgi:hypothetical protein
MARNRRHYEVWDGTPTGADIVGHADSLPAALRLYLRTRKAAPRHTVNLLGHKSTGRSFATWLARRQLEIPVTLLAPTLISRQGH